jgi:glycosyltransferase involved in cell wall biosynthesis
MNGVDSARFHPRDRQASRAALGVPDDARVVLFVGRLEPQKGIHELLDAFEQVRARVRRATLALVGDGVSTGDVRARTARWEAGAVRILGSLPPGEVAAWMGACDIMTLPSWAEGTPNVVLEALASGRPVVATRVGGIPDVLADERAGILVPPRDAGALATALRQALARRWDEVAVRASGPGSWDESAQRVANVLERA